MSNWTTPNVRTPKRLGGDLEPPPPQRARANSQWEPIAADNARRARHQLFARDRVGAFSANGEDFQRAIRRPVSRRSVLQEGGAGRDLTLNVIFLAK